MKIIYSGLESSGKSLKLAMVAADLVYRNKKWAERSNKIRPIYSNLTFSPWFVDFAKQNDIPIFYWKNLEDLIQVEDADVLIDEIGTYFDARMWADLSLDVRRWLSQAAKRGVEIYGTAQDFAQVDKSFRRLVNHLYHIRKVLGSPRPSATRPPIRRPWGVCMVTELDPQGYDEDKKKFVGSFVFPSFFFIHKRYCDLFYTNAKIERSAPPPLRHIERSCELDNCTFHKTVHV